MFRFTSAEAAFQVGKCENLRDAWDIEKAKNGYEAKKIGRRVDIREDWDEIKLEWMEIVLRKKFGPENPELMRKLIDTYPLELVEHNTWGDIFWGVCDGKGENHFGKILEKIRLDLANGKDKVEGKTKLPED